MCDVYPKWFSPQHVLSRPAPRHNAHRLQLGVVRRGGIVLVKYLCWQARFMQGGCHEGPAEGGSDGGGGRA